MTEPSMEQAAEALRWVSNDEKARQLALDREMSDVAFRHTMAAEREEGQAKGRAEGEAKGRADGLRRAVQTLARIVGVEMNDLRMAELETLEVEALTQFIETLERDRRWPSGF